MRRRYSRHLLDLWSLARVVFVSTATFLAGCPLPSVFADGSEPRFLALLFVVYFGAFLVKHAVAEAA